MLIPCGLKYVGMCQYDIIMYISEEQFCAFCWPNVLNCLSIMHGMDNLKIRDSN